MTRGKKLNTDIKYEKVDMTSNIVDKSSLKSFYLLINGYFDLDSDELNKLKTKIARTIVKNINQTYFHTNRLIDIIEIKVRDKYNYGGFEYTIFLKKENIITINELEEETKRLMDIIYETHFDKPEFEIKWH